MNEKHKLKKTYLFTFFNYFWFTQFLFHITWVNLEELNWHFCSAVYSEYTATESYVISAVQSSQSRWTGQYKKCVQYNFKFTSIFSGLCWKYYWHSKGRIQKTGAHLYSLNHQTLPLKHLAHVIHLLLICYKICKDKMVCPYL